MTDEIRTIARETYQRTRIGRPHLPHEDSPEGQRKIDRLYDILAEARAALTHAASTFRWYAELHRAKGDDPANVEKIRRNEEEALKCERALLSGETK